jgi:hypothetical protein
VRGALWLFAHGVLGVSHKNPKINLPDVLSQGCDESFLSAFPPFVFEYTGGIPRLILWTYTVVFAWTYCRFERDGPTAKKLTAQDILQALEHVFDYLYHHHQVCCCCVTAQCAIKGL